MAFLVSVAIIVVVVGAAAAFAVIARLHLAWNETRLKSISFVHDLMAWLKISISCTGLSPLHIHTHTPSPASLSASLFSGNFSFILFSWLR